MARIENTLRNEVREQPLKKASKEKKEKKESEPFRFLAGLNPRIAKISGLLLMSFSVFLALAMISFLFSWQADQSVVNNLSWDIFSKANPDMTKNWMGLAGAWFSHLLIFRWFGLASFIFLPVLF